MIIVTGDVTVINCLEVKIGKDYWKNWDHF
jgi:hypothetical protein